MHVISIAGKRYALRERHWELARTHLAFGRQVPVVPLALYLFRDFALTLPDRVGLTGVVEVFRQEFGYTDENSVEYRHLFNEDGIGERVGDYLTEFRVP
jgi:hypothetical protein